MKDLLNRLMLYAPDTGAADGNSTDEVTPAETGQATGQQADPKTFTQADVDRLMGRTREEAKRAVMNELATKYGDLDALAKAQKELEEKRQAEMTELEKLQAERQKLLEKLQAQEAAAKAAQLDALRLKVGQEVGLPPALASRLQGSTAEEIKADAEAVLAALPGQPAPGAFGSTGATDGTNDKNHGLTASERAVADAAGMSYEAYAKAKQSLGD